MIGTHWIFDPRAIAVIAATLVGLFGAARAELGIAITEVDPELAAGGWYSESGSVFYVTTHGPVMELMGKDAGSAFRASCLWVEAESRMRCVGNGYSHLENAAYHYASTIRFMRRQHGEAPAEPTLREDWSATMAGGAMKSGSEIFRKVPAEGVSFGKVAAEGT